jgi:DNA-binding CsgD family transcriptional regulator
MPNRPPIPEEVMRAVFVASGHRCVVCGVPFPLEKAHIIPWHKSKDHSADNLICLCANCHERADREHWGEATLREYKRNPWVLRQNGNEAQAIQVERRRRVTISIAKDFEDFDKYEENVLRYALANFLQVPEAAVKIDSKRRGSVTVVVSLPEEAAERLAEAYQLRRADLLSALALFPISSLLLEEREFADSSAAEETSRLLEALSQRELWVLYLFGTGLSNREIAALLRISEATVGKHLAVISLKGGRSVKELFAMITNKNPHNPSAAPDGWRRR